MTPRPMFKNRTLRRGRHREARRVFVVRAIFTIFALSLLEGPLRKWLLPNLGTTLTLLRDPFVLALYAYSFVNRLYNLRLGGRIWIGFALVTGLLGLVQYIANGYGLIGWALGVRTYWLYMPLAFIIAGTFNRDDVQAFILANLMISIPYAVLVAVQYSSPAAAFVNLGVGADEGAAVRFADGLFRPFGLFTYTAPNVQYTAVMIALFAAYFLDQKTSMSRPVILTICGFSVGSMAVLTGSRAIYFMAAVITLVTIAGLSTSRSSKRFSAILGLFGFITLAGVLSAYMFPDMLDATFMRFESAARSEGPIEDRALGMLNSWVEPLFTISFLGQGIGLGAPGVANFLGFSTLVYGESDLQRNVNELGFLAGLAMIGLRFATAVWAFWLAFKLTRRGITAALPIAGFVSLSFGVLQITHSTITGFLPWFLLGVLLSLDRDRHRRIPHTTAKTPTPNRSTPSLFRRTRK